MEFSNLPNSTFLKELLLVFLFSFFMSPEILFKQFYIYFLKKNKTLSFISFNPFYFS